MMPTGTMMRGRFLCCDQVSVSLNYYSLRIHGVYNFFPKVYK